MPMPTKRHLRSSFIISYFVLSIFPFLSTRYLDYRTTLPKPEGCFGSRSTSLTNMRPAKIYTKSDNSYIIQAESSNILELDSRLFSDVTHY